MTREYEFILVGSGVAATLVADTLLRARPSASILVLEAGSVIPLRDRSAWWELALRGRTPYAITYDVQDSPANNESTSVGQTKWIFPESRVRAYGGSTMHWGGWALRFQEEDFECFTRTGRSADWPFGYAELEPWYEQAELALAVGGHGADPDGPPRRTDFPLPAFPWTAHESDLALGFERVGLKPGHMPIARFHRCMTTGTCKYCPIGSRYTAQDQLDQMRRREYPNFQVELNAPVMRLLAAQRRVVGVEYQQGGETRQAAAHQVVICAGAYESTKLLLRSTSTEWPEGVGNAHDQVGRFLVTHSMLRVSGTKPSNPSRWFQEYDFPTLMSRTWDSPKWQRRGKVFVFNNRSLPKVDLAREMIAGKTRATVDAVASGPMVAGLDAFIEEFGQRDNVLRLGKAAGRFGLPSTEVAFTRSPDMVPQSQRMLVAMAHILESCGYTVKADDMTLQDPRGDHSSGTCRMGVSPDASVTDASLRVHGVDNLYVCSNAVLPNAAAVNPTLTLAALALRLGVHLGGSVGVPR